MGSIELIKIWNETEYESQFYKIPLNSIKYSEDLNSQKKSIENCIIGVVQQDSIDAGHILLKHGLRPVVLNMCDHARPGGNVVAGTRTQEEDLFRRSNYNCTLNTSFYPLKDVDTVYSPIVTVFKDINYNRISPFNLSFIAAPSVNNPGNTLNKNDFLLMQRKIKMLFEVALKHNHDSIVLSAWGCGAFRCPPNEIANLFKNAIDVYKNYFKYIIFAIKNKDENFAIFKNIIH